MKETICTIPINDVFGPKDGCPICRLHDMLEQNYLDYILGAAMMEPDVRTETNQKGFCTNHFQMMVGKGHRLQNALILETHLDKIKSDLISESAKGKPDKKTIAALEQLQQSCYVCDKINWGMEHMFSTIFSSFANDSEFRKLYEEQPFICLPHYTMLIKSASSKGGMKGSELAEFYKSTAKLSGKYLSTLKDDVSHYCKMYDYRNKGMDWGNSRDSIERSVEFLTSQKPNYIDG